MIGLVFSLVVWVCLVVWVSPTPNECLLIFILGFLFLSFSLRFFSLLFRGRTSYSWHFLARSLCLNIDLLQKFFDPWIKERDLAQQMFLTWNHLPALLLVTEFEQRFAWVPWTKGKSTTLLKWWDKVIWALTWITGGWRRPREKTGLRGNSRWDQERSWLGCDHQTLVRWESKWKRTLKRAVESEVYLASA